METSQEFGKWPSNPYKGLDYYESEDEALFAGRDSEIDTCGQLLANSQTKLLILHGQTGCGKSSFLRAGLIPALERSGTGYMFLRRRSASDPTRWNPEFIRCGADPLRRIAEEIYRYTEQPAVPGKIRGLDAEEIQRIRLGFDQIEMFVTACADPYKLFNALKMLSSALKHTLILIVDQTEEVITLNASRPENRNRFSQFIKKFATSDLDVRFVLAIRKDHSGQFIGSIQIDSEISPAYRTFFLPNLSRPGVREAIERPTLKSLPEDPEAPGPFDQYRFEFAHGVVDAILEGLDPYIPAGGALQMMQVVCRDLYAKLPDEAGSRQVALSMYQGMEAPVKQHVTETLMNVLQMHKNAGLDKDAAKLKWLRVLNRLVLKEVDGRVSTDVVHRKSLEEWANEEGVGRDASTVIDALADSNTLILRTFSVLAPGSAIEREMASLGNDMICIALSDALQEAEGKKTKAASRRLIWTVVGICFSLVGVSAAIAWYVLDQSNATRQRNIESLIAKSAATRSDNLLDSLAFAKQAQGLVEKTMPGFSKSSVPEKMLIQLLAGIPAVVSEGIPAKGAGAATIYPLPKSGGFAILRTDNILEVVTTDGGGSVQSFNAPNSLVAADGKANLIDPEFSEVSANLLMAMYKSIEQHKSGVVAFPKSGVPKVLRYDDLINALGAAKEAAPPMYLYGLTENSVVLFNMSSDLKSIHLKSLKISDSLDIQPGIDRWLPTPTSSFQVDGRWLTAYSYEDENSPLPGLPGFSITKFEMSDIFSDETPRRWEVKEFSLMKKCIELLTSSGCKVASVQQLQQKGLVVLGLWQLEKGRFGAFGRWVMSGLIVVDLKDKTTKEISVRASTLARDNCTIAGARDGAPGLLLDHNAGLRDEDVPMFLVKGERGLVLGYTTGKSAQLLDISNPKMQCREIYFPDAGVNGWSASQDGKKLLATSRSTGYVWDLQASAVDAQSHSAADELKRACTGQLFNLKSREGEPRLASVERQKRIAEICP